MEKEEGIAIEIEVSEEIKEIVEVSEGEYYGEK
jgi:hypothetical protein